MAIEIEPGAIYVRYERLAQVYPLGEAALLRGGKIPDIKVAVVDHPEGLASRLDGTAAMGLWR